MIFIALLTGGTGLCFSTIFISKSFESKEDKTELLGEGKKYHAYLEELEEDEELLSGICLGIPSFILIGFGAYGLRKKLENSL